MCRPGASLRNRRRIALALGGNTLQEAPKARYLLSAVSIEVRGNLCLLRPRKTIAKTAPPGGRSGSPGFFVGGDHMTLQVSFEFFPPRTPEMEENLWRAIKRLEPLAPRFVSVTYGAGGSTRERTHRTVKRILGETALLPAAHLTCVAATRAEVDEVARDYWDAGVRQIVALRGDPPKETGRPCADAGRLRLCRRPRRRAQAHRRLRGDGGRLSRGPSRVDIRVRRPRQPEAEDRRRAPRARSPSSSSRTTSTSAISSDVTRPASPARSCPASCR